MMNDISSIMPLIRENRFNVKMMNDISSIMPLIREKVNTLDTQFHCMEIIKNTVSVINEGLTPVDQPVYALSKQIQWRFPELFRDYFCLFGALHVEKSLLVIHGEFIKGSGLSNVLGKCNLSVIGLENTLVNATDIKRARYAIQVAACAVYEKLKEVYDNSSSDLSIWDWLHEKCNNVMCLYWKNVLELQLSILVYITSIRESNFQLHLAALRSLMKWYFALDHFNYARWLSVNLFDLLQVKGQFPDIYNQFSVGQFTFQKTISEYFNMALDQVHEQNNTKIKGIGGATHLVNLSDESPLVRWELCAGELTKMLQCFNVYFVN